MVYPTGKLASWHDTNFMDAHIGQLNFRKAVSIYTSARNEGDVLLKTFFNIIHFFFESFILSTKEEKIQSYEAFQSHISKPRYNSFTGVLFHDQDAKQIASLRIPSFMSILPIPALPKAQE